jgi:uncharacterized protein with von Willebrand factor type A (vWA) domain
MKKIELQAKLLDLIKEWESVSDRDEDLEKLSRIQERLKMMARVEDTVPYRQRIDEILDILGEMIPTAMIDGEEGRMLDIFKVMSKLVDKA